MTSKFLKRGKWDVYGEVNHVCDGRGDLALILGVVGDWWIPLLYLLHHVESGGFVLILVGNSDCRYSITIMRMHESSHSRYRWDIARLRLA
jgi:hypothetical protein